MLDDILTRSWLLPEVGVRVESRDCNGTSVRVVRDDLLHPWASGNKLRKLDAWLPQLRSEGVTDIVTCGGAHSAHAAAVGALAAERGMNARLLLRGEPLDSPTGYNVVSHCFGDVRYVDRDTYADRSFVENEAQRLRDSGVKAAAIPEGAAGVLAMYGLIRLVRGIMLSVDEPFSNKLELVVDTGTGTTAAGLALGVALLELPWKVQGICLVPNSIEDCQNRATALWNSWNEQGPSPDSSPIVVWNERVQPRRFGTVRNVDVERCLELAKKTGILFDPVYTLAAWEALENRSAKERSRCVLVHTGGGLNLLGAISRQGITFS